MNHKTRSFPHAFLRSFGLAAVVVAAATGASTAQAQEQEQEQMEEWLVPIARAFEEFAVQWVEDPFSFISVNSGNSQLERMNGAVCSLTDGEGSEAVDGIVESIRPEALWRSLSELPEDSWRGFRYTNFLEWEDGILQERGYSEAVRASSLTVMAAHKLIRWFRIDRLWNSLFREFSRSAVRGAVDSLCRDGRRLEGLAERLRWTWSGLRILGGLFLVSVNTVAVPEQSIWREMSIAAGSVLLASGIIDAADL